MNQIRIAQIIGKWVGGGVEAVVMNFYRHINRDKVQFDFICDEDSIAIPYEEIEKLGGKVILIPPYQNFIKYQKELKKVLKNGKYKIIHSHINTLSVFPLRAAKKVGIPVRIAHNHSTSNKKEVARNLIKQILRPFAKVYANNYFCCSEYAGRWLFGNKSYDKGEVYLLNNAIELDQYKYDGGKRTKIRKDLGISNDTFVIGHIGRFCETKNQEFLIDVFSEVVKKRENVLLLLIGQGPQLETMKNKVLNLGLKDKVKFLGQREDANILYQAMDVFAFPSLYEGLGLVVVEALTSGLKCIVSNFVPKEVDLVKDKVFFCNLENKETWVEEILREDKIRNINIDTITKKYDIISKSKELEDFYLKTWRK